MLRGWPLPRPDADGDKTSRGTVLAIGGSPQMPGAIVLAGIAALRAGAGRLQIATTRSIARLVASQVPEAMVIALPETRSGGIAPSALREIVQRAGKASAVLLGPGLVDTRAAGVLAAKLCARLEKVPLILDAEALECCAVHPRDVAKSRAQIAITPHAREMAHVLQTTPASIARDPAGAALRAARELRCVAVLKGATTFIAAPDGTLLRHDEAGNAGLGTSGSGDTLCGILAGLSARGADRMQAAAWGVHVHGMAGDALAKSIGPVGYLARELLSEIPRALAKLS
jgi:ADP-dependent NAD(P)H-hydrate dehydratase